MFQYHGAEHKTITTYEADEALTVENARAKTTLHPRCGTTFLVMVALVSIFVFAMVAASCRSLAGGRRARQRRLLPLKLPFLPLIAAVTFEIQRVFARYCTTALCVRSSGRASSCRRSRRSSRTTTSSRSRSRRSRTTLWRERGDGAASARSRSPIASFADFAAACRPIPGYGRAA